MQSAKVAVEERSDRSTESPRSSISNRPTVLIVGPTPPPFHGPAINTMALLESETVSRSFDLVIVDTADRRSVSNLGRLDLTNVWLALRHGISYLASLIRHKPSLVYVPVSQNPLGFLRDCLFMIPAILTRRRLVLHLRGGYFHLFYAESPAALRVLIRYVLRHTTRVIVLGESLRHIFEGLIAPSRIVVIPNGLDPEPFDRLRPELQARSPERRRVTYLGILTEEKGYWTVLQAVPDVLRQFPDVEFVFAGQFSKPDGYQRVQEFIARSGIEKNVTFPGVVTGDDKVRLLVQSYIFVFPTYYRFEGHPMVILEAMAAGLPVITADQGAIRETVVDGGNGFLVPKRHPGAVAERILELLMNPDLRDQMGEAARGRFLKHYTFDRWARQMVRLFGEALGDRLTPETHLGN